MTERYDHRYRFPPFTKMVGYGVQWFGMCCAILTVWMFVEGFVDPALKGVVGFLTTGILELL